MFDKLESIVARYDELTGLLSDPAVLTTPDLLRTYGKEQADLRPIVTAYQEYCRTRDELQENRALLQGETLEEDFAALVREEIETLQPRLEDLQQQLRLALLPRDPHDARSAIIEIRAGTGGDLLPFAASSTEPSKCMGQWV